MMELRKIREKTEKGKQVDGIVINQNDLDTIRNRLVIKTKDEIQKDKILAAQKQAVERQAATLRKKKMVDLDRQRAKMEPMTDMA